MISQLSASIVAWGVLQSRRFTCSMVVVQFAERGPPAPPGRSAAHYTTAKFGKLIPRRLIWINIACFLGALGGADIKEAPMRTLAALTILTMSIALADGQARAQTYAPGYPVCMRVTNWGGSTYYDCSYYTRNQCAASASGRAAQCDPNPYYSGNTVSAQRTSRGYRQVR